VGLLSPSIYRTGAPRAVPNSRYSYPVTDSELPSLTYSLPHSGHCSQPARTLNKRIVPAQHGLNLPLCHTHNRFLRFSICPRERALRRYHVLRLCIQYGSEASQTPNRAVVCYRGTPIRVITDFLRVANCYRLDTSGSTLLYNVLRQCVQKVARNRTEASFLMTHRTVGARTGRSARRASLAQ